MSEIWKSPRKVEEEINLYRRERFERHLGGVALGEYASNTEAIAALRDEINGTVDLEVA